MCAVRLFLLCDLDQIEDSLYDDLRATFFSKMSISEVLLVG